MQVFGMSLLEVNLTILLIYGPCVCLCTFFIIRNDSKTAKAAKEMVGEIRTLAHRINGLMRQQLVATLAQRDLDPKVRAFGEALLEAEEEADRRNAGTPNIMSADDAR